MKNFQLTNGAANPTINQREANPDINRQLTGMGFTSYQTEGGLTLHEKRIGNVGKIVVSYPNFMQLVIGNGGVLHLTKPTIPVIRNLAGMFDSFGK